MAAHIEEKLKDDDLALAQTLMRVLENDTRFDREQALEFKKKLDCISE